MAVKVTAKAQPKMQAAKPPVQQDNVKAGLPVTEGNVPKPRVVGAARPGLVDFGPVNLAEREQVTSLPFVPREPDVPPAPGADDGSGRFTSFRDQSRPFNITPPAQDAPTPGPQSEFQKFRESFGLGAEFAANQFGTPARPDFDPSFQGPNNVEEVDIAEAYLRDAKTATRGLTQNALGEWGRRTVDANGLPGFTPATQQELLFIERIGELEGEMIDVEESFRNVNETNKDAQRRFDSDLLDDFLQKQEQDEKDRAQTPEEVAAIEAVYNQRYSDLQSRLRGEEATANDEAALTQQITESRRNTNQQLSFTKTKRQEAVLARDEALISGDARAAAQQQAADDFFAIEELRLEKEQFQLDIFKTLAGSPEILFFLGQRPGMLQQFGELMGDGGEALNRVFTNLNKQPVTNIQEFARLNQEQQGIEAFRLSARTGTRDAGSFLQGQAPTQGTSVISRQRLARS